MIGAILGDIIGSRFEFHNYLGKDFELLTRKNEFTDDTVMTCAVAEALMDSRADFSDLSQQAVNSCGNGSAMRISAVGFAAKDVEEAKRLSAAVTCISHDHPEGMKGAEATAVAIVMARQGKSKEEIRAEMEKYYDLSIGVDTYRRTWDGHGREICQISVPQALACFFEGEDYEDVIRNCISIGGDSDTIAAIAGGIAEAFYGVPEKLRARAADFLPPQLLAICRAFDRWQAGRMQNR